MAMHISYIDWYYNTKQACELLGVHETRITAMVRSGQLPKPTKVKSCNMFPAAAIHRLVEARKISEQLMQQMRELKTAVQDELPA